MKKFAFLLLAILPFISCEDTETNEVALQAKINDRLYQSTDARASTSEDGGLVIQGSNMSESLTLTLSGLREGNFQINEGTSNNAKFTDAFGNVFNTTSGGEGAVNISEVDEINKTLTGTFNFSAVMRGVDTIYVSRGVLYRVPYGVPGLPGPDTGAETFRAKIDGNPFNPLLVVSSSGLGTIVLQGSTADSGIVLSMPDTVEPGEYQVDWDFSADLMGMEHLEEETLEGVIKIQAHDPEARTIKGTFWFNTTSHAITEGVFDLVYESL